jgi:hypothetical protein
MAFLGFLKSRNGWKSNRKIHQSSFWRVSPQSHCRIGWDEKRLAANHSIEVGQPKAMLPAIFATSPNRRCDVIIAGSE